jgi:hypothetical protein
MKIGLAWLATGLAVVGCSTGGAARSARTTPAGPGLGFVTTGLQSAGGGRVHLTGYTDSDSPTSSVILIGAIGDFGRGRLDQSTGHFDLYLSRGSLTLQFADLDAPVPRRAARAVCQPVDLLGFRPGVGYRSDRLGRGHRFVYTSHRGVLPDSDP